MALPVSDTRSGLWRLQPLNINTLVSAVTEDSYCAAHEDCGIGFGVSSAQAECIFSVEGAWKEMPKQSAPLPPPTPTHHERPTQIREEDEISAGMQAVTTALRIPGRGS